ncbi:MAG: hypothetical protein K0S33_3034 [Bacteroidetes bacterium]|jgi:hypothetical protein|nr:hypothetical protein [Bacteroidota bacterium]
MKTKSMMIIVLATLLVCSSCSITTNFIFSSSKRKDVSVADKSGSDPSKKAQ